MTARLRRAQAQDVPAIVRIKEALAIAPGTIPRRGGFLLGCSAERYAWLVDVGSVLLLEDEGEVGGFAVTLRDPVLRASELWQRRSLIRWSDGEGEPPEHEPVGYFDQLALRPGANRLHAPTLALAAALALAEEGHVHLYASIIDRPVRNEASLPLLRALGARPVARVEEHYRGVGEVVSELHHVRLPEALAALAETTAGMRTARAGLRLAA